MTPCHSLEDNWSEGIFIRILQTSISLIICGHRVKMRIISTTFFCCTAQLCVQIQENTCTRRTSGKFETTDVRNYVRYEFCTLYWPSRWRSLLITSTTGRTNLQSHYWKRKTWICEKIIKTFQRRYCRKKQIIRRLHVIVLTATPSEPHSDVFHL
jgi:hypothetical protein